MYGGLINKDIIYSFKDSIFDFVYDNVLIKQLGKYIIEKLEFIL